MAFDGLPERGRDFVLKLGEDSTNEVFTTIAGQRLTSMTINGDPVDVSDKSDDWRELLTGAALKSISAAASGVFKNTEAAALLRRYALEQTLNYYQLAFQDGDVWEGLFLVTSLEETGEVGGAREFSMELESSGEITFDQVT